MPDTPLDDAEVHVLDARSSRGGRGAWIIGLVLVLAIGGLGAWVALTDPFAESAAVEVVTAAPENRLDDAWSFETTETVRASEAWKVPAEAPTGFTFVETAAVSGQLGASASPGEGEWSEIVLASPVALGMHKGGVKLSAVAAGEGVQLFARFESDGRAPIELVAAMGAGALEGVVPLPPGAETVRAGLRAFGSASVDDVTLELVDATPASIESRGVYSVLTYDGELIAARGSEPALVVKTPTVRLADERSLPPGVGADAAGGDLVLADGSSVSLGTEVSWEGQTASIASTWGGGPGDATSVHVVRVLGPLADEAIGVASASSGFQRFDDDFTVPDAAWLTLGRTQDRLVLRVDEGSVRLVGARRADGGLDLRFESPLVAGTRVLRLQTSFTDERVRAAARRDAARSARDAGQLGVALGEAETVLRDHPYDEAVLREAGQIRSELLALMQQRLDEIDADLEDALFLASARRCREVLEDCEAAAQTFAGSSAAARFAERAEVVRTRAAELLEADRQRHAERLEAIATSLESYGGFERLAAEYRNTLERWMAPAEEGSN